MGRLFWGIVVFVWSVNSMLGYLWDHPQKEFAATMTLIAVGIWSVLKRIDERTA